MKNLLYIFTILFLTSFFTSCESNKRINMLSDFGLINEELTTSNSLTESKNNLFIENLILKRLESGEQYAKIRIVVNQIDYISENIENFIEQLKSKMEESVDNPTDYETMEGSEFLDKTFFNNQKLSPIGEEFLNHINNYRKKTITILDSLNDTQNIIKAIKINFNTENLMTRDGNKIPWLQYHYKGIPLIASLTKLSLLQSEIKNTKFEILSKILLNSLEEESSMVNYTTFLTTKKKSYFKNETIDGEIILWRRDSYTKPNSIELTLDGKELIISKDFTIEGSSIKLNINSGKPGKHFIKGNLEFRENNYIILIPVNSSFVTK